MPTLSNKVKGKVLTFEDWKKKETPFTLSTQSPENCTNENGLNIKQ